MLMKICKLNLSNLRKSHALSPNEKILHHIYFLSHFATMPIDSANPVKRNLRKAWIGALAAMIEITKMLKKELNTSQSINQ